MNLKSRNLETLFGTKCKTMKIQDLNLNRIFDFNDLSEQVNNRVRELADHGVKKHSRYLLRSSNSFSFFVDLFSLWELEAHPFIISADLTDHESQLIQERVLKKSSPIPDDTALVLLTSGTTAEPKAVVHTMQGLLTRLEILNNAIPLSDRESTLCVLPLYFGHGLIGISLLSLYSGQNLIVAPVLNFDNAELLPQWLESSTPTFISSTPALWEIILRAAPTSQVKLRRAQVASAHTQISLFERIKSWSGCPVFNVYGFTECASWVSDSMYNNQNISVGNGQRWNLKFRISHPHSDGLGAIEIQTSGIFWGYWDYAGPEYMTPDNWFKTGDYGYVNDRSELFLVGRESRIINRQGLKVSAEEVESYILDNSEVVDAVVLAFGSDLSQVGALIVLKNTTGDHTEVKNKIINTLKLKISSFKIPSQIKLASEIPRKVNGKPDLQKIKVVWDTL